MANSVSYLSSALLLILLMAFVIGASNSIDSLDGRSNYNRGPRVKLLEVGDCATLCKFRCPNEKGKGPCIFRCTQCCITCMCVPSATFANNWECPCYTTWKDREGIPKCP